MTSETKQLNLLNFYNRKIDALNLLASKTIDKEKLTRIYKQTDDFIDLSRKLNDKIDYNYSRK